MQRLADLIGNITSAYTSTLRIVVLGAIVLGAIITGTIMYAAPAVVENVGERAERISEKAIQAAREESRAHAMAQDGWGYSSASASADTAMPDTSDDASGDYEANQTYNSSSDYDSRGEYADNWGAGAD